METYTYLKGKAGIYCFTNLINNKKYIGQSVNLYARIKAHYANYKNPKYHHLILYKAILKYGIDNFKLEIIECIQQSDNVKEELDQLEIKYIKQFNSYSPNGYNMTLGGDAGVLGLKMTSDQKNKIKKASLIHALNYKKPIYLYNILDQNKYYFYSTTEAILYLSKLYDNIPSEVNLRKLRNSSYGKLYCNNFIAAKTEEELDLRIQQYNSLDIKYDEIRNKGKYIKGCKNKLKYRSVVLLDSNNNIIEKYDSVKFVPKIWGKSQDTIRRKIKNKIKDSNGMFLQYEDCCK